MIPPTEPASPLPCFILCSADGPDSPFVGQMLWWDIARVVCLLAGVAMVVLTPACVLASPTWAQRARFVAFGLFCLSAIATEWEHLGDYASARLACNVVGALLALGGTVAFLRREAPPRRPRRVGAHRSRP